MKISLSVDILCYSDAENINMLGKKSHSDSVPCVISSVNVSGVGELVSSSA